MLVEKRERERERERLRETSMAMVMYTPARKAIHRGKSLWRGGEGRRQDEGGREVLEREDDGGREVVERRRRGGR